MLILSLISIMGTFLAVATSPTDSFLPEYEIPNPDLFLADETTELGPTFIFPDEGLDQEYTTLSDTTPFFPDDSVTSLSPGNVVWDQTPGQDSAFLSPDYGLLSDQTTALDPILFYDDVLNEDQLDEPDWALSLDEDMDWLSRTAETDAIFLFADADIDCEIHDDGRVQRLHKTRRGASCSSPTMEQSEKEKPKRPDEDSFDFKAFIEHQPPSEIFSDNTELCSEEKFKKSIIPVLKNDAIPGSLVWNYPNPWFSLLDVLPLNYYGKPTYPQEVWCCELVLRRGEREGSSPPSRISADFIPSLSLLDMFMTRHIQENIYDAYFCYPQSILNQAGDSSSNPPR